MTIIAIIVCCFGVACLWQVSKKNVNKLAALAVGLLLLAFGLWLLPNEHAGQDQPTREYNRE